MTNCEKICDLLRNNLAKNSINWHPRNVSPVFQYTACSFCVEMKPRHSRDEYPWSYLGARQSKRVTLDQAERENLIEGVPFGCRNERWKEFISQMIDGDELWYFWHDDCGGMELIRDGISIDAMILQIS